MVRNSGPKRPEVYLNECCICVDQVEDYRHDLLAGVTAVRIQLERTVSLGASRRQRCSEMIGADSRKDASVHLGDCRLPHL